MMKYLLLFMFCFSMCFWQCKKDDALCTDGMQEARIIGQDYRRCMCCSGWFIELGKDTVRAFVLPEGFEFSPMSDLPLKVCLSYHEEPAGPCQDFDHLVVIDEITRL